MTFSHVPRVLIVDDYPESARVLAQLLRIFGFETLLAYDGASAVSQATDFAPDAVVLDVILPDIDGYEVARQLRAGEATRGTLIVALTGYHVDDSPRAGEDNPFDYHLGKPIAPSVLRDLLWNALTESAASAR
jgi:two-component system OmpR family response regulator